MDWSEHTSIGERSAVSATQFRDEVQPAGQPMVLREQVRQWPLVGAGLRGPASFAEFVAPFDTGRPIKFFEAEPKVGGRIFYSDDLQGFNFERKETLLNDFIHRLDALRKRHDSPTLYAGAVPLPDHLPDLLGETDHGLLGPETEQLVSLWIGNRARTAAHFDLPQNLACVLAGRRRFIVLPTQQLPNLYLGPLDRTIAGQPVSMVDFLNPDFDAHPRFREAIGAAQVATLEPGDVLYLPSMWFHHVETLDAFGAMLNFWWRDAAAHLFTPMITLMHSLLSIVGLPERERAAWKVLFDHYVFETNGAPMAHLPESARGLFGELSPEQIRRLKFYLAKSLNG